MGKLKQKGKSGAAKAYITRSSAIKKLQCSLADFRRLCILKGIFPREPRHRKRANKGSSAPTTFYYAKDIAYLSHEPILHKLREHKAFAKKLARALGRGEWSSAKSLEENKPVYTLDHIVKERYPTFIDALRDIDDALCLIHLFAALPTSPQIPTSLINNCTRLSAEWQLYVMRTHALRKVFLSIKGIYFQAEVMGQTITWLVPYQFTQPIPVDVDARVMLTFVELYQTLLGFVFFKLYSDISLLYPPPINLDKDEAGAGVGAFTLEDIIADQTTSPAAPTVKKVEVGGKIVTNKDVKRAIMDINATPLPPQSTTSVPKPGTDTTTIDVDILPDDFIVQPSKSADGQGAPLLTMRDIAVLPSATSPLLFSSLNIFLSRETPRPLLEFVIRALGGRVGWPATLGEGSPFDENDPLITHVIIDRPLSGDAALTGRRKYVQPQWIIDSINAGRLLVEDTYAQGKILPPHLSPFGEGSSTYIPDASGAEPTGEDVAAGSEESEEEEEEEEDKTMAEAEAVVSGDVTTRPALAAAAAAPEDPALRRAAEIEAERAGAEYTTFEADLKKAIKKTKKAAEPVVEDNELEMNKMLMSNKQRKLYERMKHGEKKRALEKSKLEQKRDALRKARAKEIRKGTNA
ncbi:Pescadillo homolog OS=Coprinopsis cinerea (strain Okayama-7 / 130 / ATCC MYA-4618 / FGSC 9003) GN=NOP7 PE=3 SV=1 [Rhizoctonia solani AG-1 IB]|uniref:Pescadillo homolog n=1 Tax=Thanatephorus cucumeris (strain AG1-IB / isolate 7/3/14) TaxID=1108050 RepID=A0A0B7FMF4_THACB|nr:Pescadillo homolog OS=Coprinopsis cinerea (strain Okayama-7 / 130 / ATCC MYA-4618 / FGSC 9003) GN=NOP7 PE=3 SV=1 [Rhizoctonia solani AG-1 IB]